MIYASVSFCIYIPVLACLLHFTALYCLLIACELYCSLLYFLPACTIPDRVFPISIALFLLVARVINLPERVVLTVCSTYLMLYYLPACWFYLLDCSSFLPIFIYLLVVIYLPVLLTVYLLSIASLGVWYSPLPVPVYCFPIRLWSFAAIALSLSFVLSHLSRGGRLVESHSVVLGCSSCLEEDSGQFLLSIVVGIA